MRSLFTIAVGLAVLFERAAHAPTEHWNLPEAGHTAAVRDFPAAYEERVVGFLDDALLRYPASVRARAPE